LNDRDVAIALAVEPLIQGSLATHKQAMLLAPTRQATPATVATTVMSTSTSARTNVQQAPQR
jgi:hypothetical protein